MKPVLGFIGAGRVGHFLALSCQHSGYQIAAAASRSQQNIQHFAQRTGAEICTPAEVVKRCNLIFLTVPDDLIAAVGADLTDADWSGRAVVHTSGAAAMDILDMLRQRGAYIGSFHPAYPIASTDAVPGLEGVAIATESSDAVLTEWLTGIIQDCGGYEIRIPPGEKPRYHAALVLASNFTVTLYAAAEQMLLDLGASRSEADAALNMLLRGTISNIREQGIPAALTGPLVRPDPGTIRSHLRAMDDPLLRDVYRGLVRLSYPMLQQRGIDTTIFEWVLRESL